MKKRVGQYLLDCLRVNGLERIFGVPGDFNLAFLDDIIADKQIEWVGNTNELNASYAADGYARLHGLAAMVTTFGVGELSAVNGIAGSYAERVPVVEITGAPTRQAEAQKRYVHHSLGEGHFDNYQKIYEHITATTAYITTENAQDEIPRVINTALRERRPVHIHLPIDVAMSTIEIKRAPVAYQHQSQPVTAYLDAIQQALATAKRPVIIAGHEITAYQLQEQLEAFVNKTKIPLAQLSLGKSAFNEENPYYIGIYDGRVAEDSIRNYVDGSDCILNIGAKLTDSATTGFSYQFDLNDLILINQRDFKAGDLVSHDVSLVDLMDGLLTIDYENQAAFPSIKSAASPIVELSDQPLTQKDYFKLMQNFLQAGDVLLAEQGTSFFGAYDLRLPKGSRFVGQPLWGSIGYTLPSLLGTQVADPKRRNILLIGDGSLQLTVQEMATMIRLKLNPIILVINNDGYTVERLIHGMQAPYNDIFMWDYKALPKAFGDKGHVITYDVTTSRELQTVMDQVTADPAHMHFIEVHMDRNDSPEKLIAMAEMFAQANQ